MQGKLLLLALCLGLTLGAPAAAPADPEVAALLDRAQLWQARNRIDLAREALDKLFRVAPDQPDGLLMLARLELRANRDAEAARTFGRLREASPGHPGIAQLAAAFRIRGVDRDRMRQARQLARAGRTDQALKAYRALFPEVFPDDEMVLEYAQVLAATRDGWEQARVLFADLAGKNAQDPAFRLALAGHLSTRKPVSADTLRALVELSAVPSVSRQARAAWRRAVLGLDAVAESLPALQEYVASEPGDTAVREKLDQVAKAVGQQRGLPARPAARPVDPAEQAKREGLALLEGGRLEAAQARLQEAMAARPDDAEVVGGLGLLRLRQGRHAEALEHFLEAGRLDASHRAKWEGLSRTARYWGLLNQARQARESGQWELAERHLGEARGLDPKEPEAAIELARVRAGQGRGTEAEPLYREALAMAPGNASALEGLIGIFLKTGRDREAEALMEKLTPERRREVVEAIDVLRVGRLRDKAAQLQAQARGAEALETLEQAAAIDRNDPWMRLDLARLYAARGQAQRGRELFEELLRRRQGDPDTLFALALFLSGVDRESEALAFLERVREADRTSGMARLQRRLWVSVQGGRAVALAKSGRQAQAAQILEAARDAIGDDGDLALDVAGAFVQTGDPDAAGDLLRRFSAAPAQPTLEWRIGQARILNRMDADAELRAVLDQIATLGPATREQDEAIGELKLALSLRQAEALRASGRLAEAIRVLQDSRRARLTPAQEARHGYVHARALRASRRWDEAAGIYRAILRANPQERDAQSALVETLIESGQESEARQLVEQILHSPQGREPDSSASLAGSLIELGDFAGARSLVESALEADPDHPRALAYAGQLARREGRVDRAIDYLRRSLASGLQRRSADGAGRLSRIGPAPVPGGPLSIDAAPAGVAAAERGDSGGYRQLAGLLDQETGWISAALDRRSRSGTRGKSRLDALEVPLEWNLGWRRGDRWFVRADAARVNGGELDLADTAESATFGSTLLCQETCNTGTLPQVETGLALGVGLEREGLRVDVGTSPVGFPVVNLLGGILHKGDLGPVSYSVEASRRPVTSSLLSYAGAKDPNTGRTWGGVVATGLRVGFSRDSGGDHGAWSSFAWHRLGGRNVRDNDRAQLMAGAYRRVINEEDRQLTAGVTGMLWRFRENAGEFTFGHGGYYSPRSYRSLSLPVSFGLRTARSSFSMRASVSVSWSESKAAPYFPTDADLQARALSLFPVNDHDPNFGAGGPDRSYGRSLAAAWEHQLAPSTFIGGRLELERSTNYEPNRFLLYFRMATDGQAARPVAFPPEPVRPMSQY